MPLPEHDVAALDEIPARGTLEVIADSETCC
jgi:hypothetical protein